MRLKYRLTTYFIFLLLTIFQITSLAQDKKYFIITGKVVLESGIVENASVEIVKNGDETNIQSIPKTGRFRFELEYFNEYILTFSQEGYFSKKIVVSTDIPQEVWLRDNDFPPFTMIVQLITETPGIDKSFTLKPVGRIFYEQEIDNFENETYFSDIQIVEQIETAKTQTEDVIKEKEEIARQEYKELVQKQKDYSELIKEADNLYKRGQYQLALLKYIEAKRIFSDKAYPTDRIEELQDLVKAMEIAQQQKTSIEDEYQDAIIRADSQFNRKEYKDARTIYEEALLYAPGDNYASGRIKEIDVQLALLEKQKQFDELIAQADNQYQTKEFDTAILNYQKAIEILPDNPYPLAQIDKIKLEKEQLAIREQQERDFNEAIQDGDQKLKDENYEQALNAYHLALSTMPENTLAKDKIAQAEQQFDQFKQNQRYLQIVELADDAYRKKDYTKAQAEYENALKIKPQEQYPLSRLDEIRQILEIETQFAQLISNAETAYTNKQLPLAKDLYTQALKLKPTDQQIVLTIKEIDTLIAQQKLIEQYNNLIAIADEAFNKKQLETARQNYADALLLRKQEQYPRNQIQLIDSEISRIAKEKEDLARYEADIKRGDQYSLNKQYENAIDAYNDALAVKPNDQTALRKISEAESEIARIETENNYQTAISKGDNAFNRDQLDNALSFYEEALTYKPDEAYPENKISEIRKIIDQRRQEQIREENYLAAIRKADNSFAGKSYENARNEYTEALQIKPNEEYPKERIKKIDTLLAEIAEKERIEKEFAQLVREADSIFEQQGYETARSRYEDALVIHPDNDQVKYKIGNINEILKQIAEEKRKEEERIQAIEKLYREAVSNGNKLYEQEAYEESRKYFVEAQTIKPEEKLPGQMISTIDSIVADRERALALKEQQRLQAEAAYNDAIKQGDNAFRSMQYDLAQTAYNNALGIKPNEAYPQDQLNEIDRIEKLNEQYQALMEQASANLRRQEYEKAKNTYQQASNLKPNETLPKEQMALIDSLVLDVQRAEEINRLYITAVRNGQTAMKENELLQAKGFFEDALSYKPGEPVPKQLLDQVNEKIAQQEELKRLAELEEQQRLAKEKADRDKYEKAIAIADNAFNSQNYEAARTSYLEALSALPNEEYPKNRIDNIDEIITELETEAMLERQQAILDSMQKAKDIAFNAAMELAEKYVQQEQYQNAINKFEEAKLIDPYKQVMVQKRINDVKDQMRLIRQQEENYNRYIALADDLFNESKLEQALTNYKEASIIKPEEEHPKKQIAEIQNSLRIINTNYDNAISRADKAADDSDWPNAIVAYNDALKIKPEEEYPQRRLADIQRIIDTQNDNYANAIELADNAFNNKNWELAKGKYTEAISIKPEEEYPLQRLSEINQRIAEETASSISAAAEEAAYQEAIKKADNLFSRNDLNNAKMNFQIALTIKPNEKYPTEKIEEIEGLLAQRNRDRLAERQRSIDERYRQAITVADNAFREKSYEVAKLRYQEALVIKEGENYPQKQIDLINQLLSIEEPQQAYIPQLPVVRETVPAEEIISAPPVSYSQKSTEERIRTFKVTDNYGEAIEKADFAFSRKDYLVARFYYCKSSTFEPEKTYPKDQIAKINKIIEDQMSALDRNAYDNAIFKADDAFKKADYVIARFYYSKALKIKSWEQYPKDRLQEIRALTNELLSQKEEQEYQDMIAKADEAYYNRDVSVARFYYNKALQVKSDEKYPGIKLVDIQKLVEQEERDQVNQEYRDHISQGDQALHEENFGIARFHYNKALGIKSDDAYARKQLNVIKEKIRKKLEEK